MHVNMRNDMYILNFATAVARQALIFDFGSTRSLDVLKSDAHVDTVVL